MPYALYAKTSGNGTGLQGSPDTTSDIQTKRPLKTVGGNSLEGSGDISIGVSSLTGDGVDNTDPEKPVLSFPNADEVDDLTTSNKFVTAAEKTQITTNQSDIDAIEAEQITQNAAIAANTAKNSEAPGTLSGDMKYWNGSAWVLIPTTEYDEATLQMIRGVPTWTGGTPPPPSVTNPVTGEIWMDRNLGASQVATSSTDEASYGDLYQWGRATDGHEKRNSFLAEALARTDTPGHPNFIITSRYNSGRPYDWRRQQNDNLWQGVNGINNPCPSVYRLPTKAEWEAERASWRYNAAGAFASTLKLPVAGARFGNNGSIDGVDSTGFYWSSTLDGTDSHFVHFNSSTTGMTSFYRSYGLSVRCIKG